MIWACFCGDRLGPLLVCDEGGVGGDEYMDILYDGLFSFVDDLVESPEQSETIRVCDENLLSSCKIMQHVTKQRKSSSY
jgi:hypothetical protein